MPKAKRAAGAIVRFETSDEAIARDERPKEPWLRMLLGASLVRPVWGWAPNDWGLASVRAKMGDRCTSVSTIVPEDERSINVKEKKAHKAHGHAHGKPKFFWRLPMRRHQWGQEQYELHASWADLFHDLIYVGAAYQLGDVVKYSFSKCTLADGESPYPYSPSNPSTNGSSADGGYTGRRLPESGGSYGAEPQCVGLFFGVFYSMALFQCLVRHWMTDLFLHNRFEASDLAHRLWDCVTYLAVASAASGILPIHNFLDIGPWTFDVPMIIALVLLMLRYLELAVLSDDRAVRHSTAQMFTDLSIVLACWSAALLFYPSVNWPGKEQQSIGDSWLFGPGTEELWEPCVLLLAGGLAIEARMLWRTQRLAWCCPAEAARRYLREDFPRREVSLPINIEFTIHRLNEFMMLMLGETILSITISTIERHALALHYVTFTSGFIICLCMTFSFNVTEPHHSLHHVLRRDSTAGIAWLMCFGLKAFAVLQVGIGIKIALLDPTAEWSIHVKKAQWHLAGFNALCFGMVLLMRPLHGGFKKFYSPSAFRESPTRKLVFLSYVLALAATISLSFIEMKPWEHVMAVACADLGFVVLVYITTKQDKKKDKGKHGGHHTDKVDFDVLAMQLKKFRSTKAHNTPRASRDTGVSVATHDDPHASGVFSSLSFTDAPGGTDGHGAVGAQNGVASSRDPPAAKSGRMNLLPFSSKARLGHGSSVSASEGRRSENEGYPGRHLAGSLSSSVSHAISSRLPRATFNDVGGEMGFLGVVTTEAMEDDANGSGGGEVLEERMPDGPEQMKRWRLVSDTVRKLHLLVVNLRAPVDPRVDVNQLIELLIESESVATPALTDHSLRQLKDSIASLAQLFSLEEQERELETIVERHSCVDYGTGVPAAGGSRANAPMWRPQLSTVPSSGCSRVNEQYTAGL